MDEAVKSLFSPSKSLTCMFSVDYINCIQTSMVIPVQEVKIHLFNLHLGDAVYTAFQNLNLHCRGKKCTYAAPNLEGSWLI